MAYKDAKLNGESFQLFTLITGTSLRKTLSDSSLPV